jgi:hypothetical protein
MEINLDSKFNSGDFMSIPENNLKNESVLDIQKHLGNKNNKPKQILGEKKKSWVRTGLKIAGGVLGGALISGLSYKYSGVNPQPSVQSGGMSYGAKPLVEQPTIPVSEFPSVPN